MTEHVFTQVKRVQRIQETKAESNQKYIFMNLQSDLYDHYISSIGVVFLYCIRFEKEICVYILYKL